MNEATDCELQIGFRDNYVNDNHCNSVKSVQELHNTAVNSQKHSATMSWIAVPLN